MTPELMAEAAKIVAEETKVAVEPCPAGSTLHEPQYQFPTTLVHRTGRGLSDFFLRVAAGQLVSAGATAVYYELGEDTVRLGTNVVPLVAPAPA